MVSSFKSSYGVSVYSQDFKHMTWKEFRSLLQGLGSDTPLARTVQIRLETDKDIIKNFNSSQRRIRYKWRSRNVKSYSKADMDIVLAELQSAFASM
ncbi:MAG: Gp15 family bacteriophage protein [Ruminococcus bromii]|nr:Gp15 family bacteriophage protein [Ruminococcus bromii]